MKPVIARIFGFGASAARAAATAAPSTTMSAQRTRVNRFIGVYAPARVVPRRRRQHRPPAAACVHLAHAPHANHCTRSRRAEARVRKPGPRWPNLSADRRENQDQSARCSRERLPEMFMDRGEPNPHRRSGSPQAQSSPLAAFLRLPRDASTRGAIARLSRRLRPPTRCPCIP